MHVRQLLPDDVSAAAAVAHTALPTPARFEDEEGRTTWPERRTAHLQGTDPGGAWVAEQDGEVIGVALALVRDGIWGLSLMAVRPDRQARGAGTQLLQATLEHAREARGALILSSTDPRAMRMYARAGFDLHPTIALGGIVDRAAIPAGLQARPTEDLEAAAALARGVRGGAYDAYDLALLLTLPAAGALMVDGRGFAIHDAGNPIVLAADSPAVATDLLWSCLAAAPRGATVGCDFLTAGQDWAVRAGLAAGLLLTPDGPLYTRGELGPLRPWIPSGTVL